MGYSLHIPLPHGTLKIKSKNRLRYRERYGEAPAFHLLSTYIVWEPKASNLDPNRTVEERRAIWADQIAGQDHPPGLFKPRRSGAARPFGPIPRIALLPGTTKLAPRHRSSAPQWRASSARPRQYSGSLSLGSGGSGLRALFIHAPLTAMRWRCLGEGDSASRRRRTARNRRDGSRRPLAPLGVPKCLKRPAPRS
jgi:hypothetical protein